MSDDYQFCAYKSWEETAAAFYRGDEKRKGEMNAQAVSCVFKNLGDEIHEIKVLNGWDITTPEKWADVNQVPADLALIHSEVSEALEAFRKDDRENFAEEMADTFIRVVGLCHGLKIDLCQAVRDKIAKNRERGYRHGGKRL